MLTPEDKEYIKGLIETRVTRVIPSLRPGYDSTSGLTLAASGHVLRTDSGQGVGCWLQTGSDETIPVNTQTDVDLTGTVYDTSAFFSGGAPDRITFPLQGSYFIYYKITWSAASVDGYRESSMLVSSARLSGYVIQFGHMKVPAVIDTEPTVVSGSSMVQVDAGDTLKVRVEQNSSGGDLDVTLVEVIVQYISGVVA